MDVFRVVIFHIKPSHSVISHLQSQLSVEHLEQDVVQVHRSVLSDAQARSIFIIFTSAMNNLGNFLKEIKGEKDDDRDNSPPLNHRQV